MKVDLQLNYKSIVKNAKDCYKMSECCTLLGQKDGKY